MAQSSVPQLPGVGGRASRGVFGVVGLLAVVIALFGLYLVSPFFTVGEYERTVVTRFGQFSSVAGPGLHFRIPFVNGLETFPIGIQRMTKDHLNTYTVDNQELDAAVTLNYRIAENDVRKVFTTNRDYRANLESFMIDRFKREMGKINITQVAAHRGDVALAVQKSLEAEALALFGISIVDFQINDIRYTEQYRRAVGMPLPSPRPKSSNPSRSAVRPRSSRSARRFRPRAKPTQCASRRAARPTASCCCPLHKPKARSWSGLPKPRRWARRCAPTPRSFSSRSPSAGRATCRSTCMARLRCRCSICISRKRRPPQPRPADLQHAGGSIHTR
jgi:hypothetical protein